MPEYSTPKLTPAETTQLPGMNGSSSGYVLTSELLDIIRSTYGQANGVATLDSSGKLPTAQLPDIADDVLVYASKALLPAQGVEAKIYITTDDNVLYRWDATLGDYVQLSVDLSDYATLDDLAAEESARQTADANLNNAINQLDHRLENLEQSKGDYIVQSYKDGSTTPSGKGKWCVVEGVEGVSRVENQLMNKANYPASATYGNLTFTNNGDGSFTFSCPTALDSAVQIPIESVTPAKGAVSGHTYVFKGGAANINFGTGNGVGIIDNGNGTVATITFGTSISMGFGVPQGTVISSPITVTPLLTDLNVYFSATDLSFLGATDSAKLATIQKDYPHLLQPTEYGTRIVDWTGNGVRAFSANIYDQEWELGVYDTTTGAKTANNNNIRSKNPIGVSPSTDYYFLLPSSTMVILWYDIGGNFISYDVLSASNKKTSPSNAHYVTFYMASGYGTTYGNNIQICLDSFTEKTTFHNYFVTTLSFPSTTLKSAGSVRDTLELNVEVEGVARRRDTQRIGSGTIAIELIYTRNDNPNVNYAVFTAPTSFSTILANMRIPTCESGYGWGWDSLPRPNMYLVYSSANNQIAISVSKSTTLEQAKAQFDGLGFNYALATESVTLSDPILDNTLLTESGGRLSTVQTGTVVDGIADLGFITL